MWMASSGGVVPPFFDTVGLILCHFGCFGTCSNVWISSSFLWECRRVFVYTQETYLAHHNSRNSLTVDWLAGLSCCFFSFRLSFVCWDESFFLSVAVAEKRAGVGWGQCQCFGGYSFLFLWIGCVFVSVCNKTKQMRNNVAVVVVGIVGYLFA